MSPFLFLSPLVNLAIGAALLLAWRYDKDQPFTRWIGLAFLVNASWILGYWLYFQPEPARSLGIALWAAQQCAGLLFLFLGVLHLRGRRQPARRLWALAALMFAALVAAALQGQREALAASALLFALAAVVMSRLMLQGAAAERVAAFMLLANAAAWWIAPTGGVEQLPVQSVIVSGLRLLLGLSLLVACLEHSAVVARRLNEQVTRLTERSHQGIVVLQDGRAQYANPALLRLFRRDHLAQFPVGPQALGSTATDRLINEGRRAQLHEGRADSLTWAQQWTRNDGAVLHLRLTAWLIDWNGRPAEQIVVSDETEVHASAQRLVYEATHDRLTGLANRLGAEELMEQALRTARALQDGQLALILIDIDRFSAINDAFGYNFGDALLKQLAATLSGALGDQALLARIAGDEFLVLHVARDARRQSAELARALLDRLREPLRVQSIGLNLSASAGVAVCPEDGDAFGALLGHANLAAKAAKLAGRNAVRFFTREMNADLLDEMQLAHQMHDALREGQFELYFQPILDIASGEVHGVEALLRWNHPAEGMVSPGRFIPIAERTGLIVSLGDWVIDNACATLARWQAMPGLSALTLAINVSAMQFGRGDVHRVVAAALDRHGPHPRLLELEVTESALIQEPERFVELLARLRSLGVRLAIDDFGTGYSNLAYLQRFEVDKLKVDQSFVQDLARGTQAQAIVKAVAQMAASLGLKTVAEGIEDAPTLALVRQLGCDLAQGFHFSRPLPRAAFEAWCAARAPGTA